MKSFAIFFVSLLALTVLANQHDTSCQNRLLYPFELQSGLVLLDRADVKATVREFFQYTKPQPDLNLPNHFLEASYVLNGKVSLSNLTIPGVAPQTSHESTFEVFLTGKAGEPDSGIYLQTKRSFGIVEISLSEQNTINKLQSPIHDDILGLTEQIMSQSSELGVLQKLTHYTDLIQDETYIGRTENILALKKVSKRFGTSVEVLFFRNSAGKVVRAIALHKLQLPNYSQKWKLKFQFE